MHSQSNPSNTLDLTSENVFNPFKLQKEIKFAKYELSVELFPALLKHFQAICNDKLIQDNYLQPGAQGTDASLLHEETVAYIRNLFESQNLQTLLEKYIEVASDYKDLCKNDDIDISVLQNVLNTLKDLCDFNATSKIASLDQHIKMNMIKPLCEFQQTQVQKVELQEIQNLINELTFIEPQKEQEQPEAEAQIMEEAQPEPPQQQTQALSEDELLNKVEEIWWKYNTKEGGYTHYARETGEFALFEAVKSRNSELVCKMLETKKCKMDQTTNYFGYTTRHTALTKAIEIGSLDIVKILLKFGANHAQIVSFIVNDEEFRVNAVQFAKFIKQTAIQTFFDRYLKNLALNKIFEKDEVKFFILQVYPKFVESGLKDVGIQVLNELLINFEYQASYNRALQISEDVQTHFVQMKEETAQKKKEKAKDIATSDPDLITAPVNKMPAPVDFSIPVTFTDKGLSGIAATIGLRVQKILEAILEKNKDSLPAMQCEIPGLKLNCSADDELIPQMEFYFKTSAEAKLWQSCLTSQDLKTASFLEFECPVYTQAKDKTYGPFNAKTCINSFSEIKYVIENLCQLQSSCTRGFFLTQHCGLSYYKHTELLMTLAKWAANSYAEAKSRFNKSALCSGGSLFSQQKMDIDLIMKLSQMLVHMTCNEVCELSLEPNEIHLLNKLLTEDIKNNPELISQKEGLIKCLEYVMHKGEDPRSVNTVKPH